MITQVELLRLRKPFLEKNLSDSDAFFFWISISNTNFIAVQKSTRSHHG